MNSQVTRKNVFTFSPARMRQAVSLAGLKMTKPLGFSIAYTVES